MCKNYNVTRAPKKREGSGWRVITVGLMHSLRRKEADIRMILQIWSLGLCVRGERNIVMNKLALRGILVLKNSM